MSTSMEEIGSWNEKVQELDHKLNKMKREMAEPFTELLIKVLKEEIFDKYQVENVFWTQYTPYFNDGEACEFTVHDMYCIIIGDEEPCEYEGSELYIKSADQLKEYSSSGGADSWTREIAKTTMKLIELEPNYFELVETWNRVTRSLGNIDDDIYLLAFGDHARVTITRDGKIEVDDYDHE